jgi:hypothetical protein
MTRIVVLPSDETACGLYRMKYPAGAVKTVRPEWDVEVYRPSQVFFGTGADGTLWQVQGIPEPQSADLLIMQRVGTKAQRQFVEWMRGQGVAVIVDADDALWAIRPDNVAFSHWNDGPSHWSHMDTASLSADLVTVTTQGLAQRYGKHGRVEVLPNVVPAEVAEMLTSVRDSLDQTPTVGWAGFAGTHPGDLEVMGDAMQRVVADTGAIVRVIGSASEASAIWGVDVDPVQPAAIGMPYYTTLTSLDIGVVPLAAGKFNQCKSYLKALEYAACGVVPVVSDTPAHRELAKTMPVRICTTPQQWYETLTMLIEHPEQREEDADLCVAAAYSQHTYEANAERWAAAWERAMARRSALMH